jgi:hypothetical protein
LQSSENDAKTSLVVKLYFNKDWFLFFFKHENILDFIAFSDTILTILILLNKTRKSFYDWPTEGLITFSWKEFLKSHMDLFQIKRLSNNDKLLLQRRFFSAFMTKRLF